MKRYVLLYFVVSCLSASAQTHPYTTKDNDSLRAAFLKDSIIHAFEKTVTDDEAARRAKIDTLTALLRRDSIHIYRFRKVRPYLNYHERNSLANPKIVNFFGPQVGIVLFERHIVGIGGYLSTRKTKLPFLSYDYNSEIRKRIEIRYLTLFYQYIIINRRFFELHVPVEYGHGRFYTDFRNLSGVSYKRTDTDFNLFAGGLQLVLKPVKWIGLSNNIGYRFANERIVDGYYYAIGVWIGFKPTMTDFNYYIIKRRRYRKAVAAVLAGR